MSGEYDAFGRAKAAGEGPAPGDAASAASGRHAASSARPAAADAGRTRRRGGWGLALLVLVAGAAGVTATLHAAVDGSADDPRAVAFTLRKDPFVAPSLLRAAPLRKALARIERDVRPDERVVGLTVFPDRAMATLTDERDQSRWVVARAAGGLSRTSLSSNADPGDVDLGALDLAPVARLAARAYRALRPYARDPSFSLLRDGTTGQPTGWAVTFSNVRQADSSWLIDLEGHPQ